MNVLEFHQRIKQNHENPRIPCENQENHDNPRIPSENHENHEHVRITLENVKIMKILEFHVWMKQIMEFL